MSLGIGKGWLYMPRSAVSISILTGPGAFWKSQREAAMRGSHATTLKRSPNRGWINTTPSVAASMPHVLTDFWIVHLGSSKNQAAIIHNSG
jgi:hypothetical protein